MSALRFHPKCWHRDEGQTRSIPRPALIAAVTDGAGVLQGVHRTWLAPDGQGKAAVETQRRAMGHLLGNAVRLTPHDDILVVGEGIETMLSLVEAVPGLPVWAALSSGHLGAVLLPETLQRLYIAIDRDPAGQRAAERLSVRATEVGIAVRVDIAIVRSLDMSTGSYWTVPMAILMRWWSVKRRGISCRSYASE